MKSNSLVPLKQARDTTEVGGKASALSKLIRAGFNVPDGFVITTWAFQKMNPVIEGQIYKHFDQLGAQHVAVRSSAMAEDSSKASWAGQLDTFLNTDRQHLIENIKRCWASVTSDRVKAYSKEKGLSGGKLAVIVQRMIPGEVSGVSFSVNPVTRDRNQIVIEAVAGLGDALVSGQVTPDNYVVDKRNFRTVARSLVEEKAVLRSDDVVKIAEDTARIEKFYGFPVDIEWTMAKNQLYILQGRPITTIS